MKKAFTVLLITFLLSLLSKAYAKDKELDLIYTGDTHAMLYPCHCPVEPDGGVSRRATLIKKLKKEHPPSLVLDSGSFFSAGLLDQNTQNTELDLSRALVNLRAMELMHYDVAALSDDEFNFGKELLSENISKSGIKFVSANIKLNGINPYVIKDVAGLKIGVTGVTNSQVKKKAAGLEFIEPNKAIAEQVDFLRKNGVNIVILLSNLGEQEDLKLVEAVPGIDVIIDGRARNSSDPYLKSGNTFILKPAWQGRRIGKAVLNIDNGKLKGLSVEDIRVSDKLIDDPGVLSILPACFSDNDCRKKSYLGTCQSPGSLKASCLFSEAQKIPLTIITTKDCSTCNPEQMYTYLKRQFPGLSATYIYYPDKKAAKLIDELKVTGLPVYLLGRDIGKDKNFETIKANLEDKGDFYLLKPEASGISIILNREKINGKLDLFISLFDKGAAELLESMREFQPGVHFLAMIDGNNATAPRGAIEAEEDLRSVCVQKYYPQIFWDYITCRAKNANSSWWEDCLSSADSAKIKNCARSEEGFNLLKENCALNQGLNIMFGPTFLLDNREIFSSEGAPSKEELKKMIKR